MESFFAYDGDFVAAWGSVCEHFWQLRAALEALWVTLGLLWQHLRHMGGPLGTVWGDFGTSLGSVWGQFGYPWVTLGHLMVTLQSLWIHLGYMKVLSQKTLIFPTYFNDFIKLFGGLWVDFRSLWGRFWRMKVTLEPLWGHFGIIFRI